MEFTVGRTTVDSPAGIDQMNRPALACGFQFFSEANSASYPCLPPMIPIRNAIPSSSVPFRGKFKSVTLNYFGIAMKYFELEQ